jgi:CRP-like cAMP-binding protein
MPALPKLDPYKSHFLAALPKEVLYNMLPNLHLVNCKLGVILFGSGDSVHYLYFPLGAVVSIVTNFQEGRDVEVGLIGTEGLVGIWAAMGAPANWHEAVVQAPGEFLKIKVDEFRAQLKRGDGLQDQLNRYTRYLLAQISQSAACNRLHRLEQRLARWLLMSHDQVRTNEFHETHEFLSHMLGTDRSEVTIAAGILRQAGMITYARGKVKILDLKGLEAASCESTKSSATN